MERLERVNLTDHSTDFSMDSPQEREIQNEAKRERRRFRIKAELFETEKAYIRHLQLVHKYFDFPLRFNCLIQDRTHTLIFSNIEQICEVNRHLLTHMEQGTIGSAFLYLAPFLKFYSTYANNHECALERLQECVEKDAKFAEFLRAQESLPELGGLKLNALLITPVQRIPRYKLLLEDLLHNTAVSHHDYMDIREAASKISELAMYINEQIRHHDHFTKMLQIQKSLVGPAPRIITPGRGFIRQGWLKKISRRGKKTQDRMFYLFTDMLLYAKAKTSENDTFTCCAIYPLKYCCVQRMFGGICEKVLLSGSFVFKINCKDDSVLVFSPDPSNGQVWLDTINTAIRDLNGPGGLIRRSTRRPIVDKTLKAVKKQKLQSTRSPCIQPIRDHLTTLRDGCRSPQECRSPRQCTQMFPSPRIRPNCVSSPRLRPNCVTSPKRKLTDQLRNVDPRILYGVDNPGVELNESLYSSNSTYNTQNHEKPRKYQFSRENSFISEDSYGDKFNDSITDRSFRDNHSSQSYISYESCDFDKGNLSNERNTNSTEDLSQSMSQSLSNNRSRSSIFTDDVDDNNVNNRERKGSYNPSLLEEMKEKYVIRAENANLSSFEELENSRSSMDFGCERDNFTDASTMQSDNRCSDNTRTDNTRSDSYPIRVSNYMIKNHNAKSETSNKSLENSPNLRCNDLHDVGSFECIGNSNYGKVDKNERYYKEISDNRNDKKDKFSYSNDDLSRTNENSQNSRKNIQHTNEKYSHKNLNKTSDSFQDSFVLVDEGLTQDDLDISLDMFADRANDNRVRSGVTLPRYNSYKQAHCGARNGDKENSRSSTLSRISQTISNSLDHLNFKGTKQDGCVIQ